ncbi:MAG: hypothetical protein GXX82_16590 [Syntrophorhabdus sp.]|nr:hypothetical protein [Syntrophorhabdus sp.]
MKPFRKYYNKYWVGLNKDTLVQSLILVAYLLTLGVLYCNLGKLDEQITETRRQADAAFTQLRLTQSQTSAALDQLKLTQLLNDPACAIKELRVEKVRENVVQISPVLKNYGKSVEKNASFKWKIEIVKNWKDKAKATRLLATSWTGTDHLKILPEQDVTPIRIQYHRDRFNDMAKGYESAVLVSITVGYHDLKNQAQRYTCVYLITRLADLKQDIYETTLLSAT